MINFPACIDLPCDELKQLMSFHRLTCKRAMGGGLVYKYKLAKYDIKNVLNLN